MTRRLREAVGAGILALILPTAWGVAVAHQAHEDPHWLRPCVYEDGSGGPLPCVWHGQVRGNHSGRSYWIDRSGHVHYLRDGR